MSPTTTKKFLRWIGFGLSLFAVVFVIDKLKDYSNDIHFSSFESEVWPLLGLAASYGVANIFLALAWKDLLQHFGLSVSRMWAIQVFGVAQLSKYIPGNVFHFVSRQALGLEAGLPAWPLAKTAIWELGVLATTGSLFIFLVLPYFYPGVSVFTVLSLFGAAVLTGTWIAGNWFDRWIVKVLGWYTVFLALTGLVFLAVLLLIVPATPIPGSTIIFIIGAYVVAWLAGFLTPGAPAGVGIREVVLYALLRPVMDDADLLAAIVLGRMVTIGGDALFYLVAQMAGQRKAETA